MTDEAKAKVLAVRKYERHHRIHGDMDGHTCLLSECPIHYPAAWQSAALAIGGKK